MRTRKLRKKLFRFFINIVTSGKYTEGRSFETSDYLIKYVLMNFITIFGGVILILFTIINIKNEVYNDALVCAVMTVICAACLFIARSKVPPLVPSWIMLVFYGILCILLVLVGESRGSNFLFMYVYPLLTIMLLGMKYGIIVSAALLIAMSAQMFIPGWSRFNYNFDTLIRMIASYILVFAVMVVVETTRKTKDKRIETQKKRMQELKEEAEKANSTKSNFLAAMSHEIRTPLNAIIGIAQIEMQDESLPDRQITAYEKIQNSGSTLLGIINDILDMSKIETGKMTLNPVDYDAPSLIHDTVQLNIVRIGSKPIKFKLSVDENLPSRLFGDELRLKQILNNLLSNAIKYTEKGQVHLSVNYKIINEDVMLVLSVSDTGQGMKEEDRKKLFSEYVRFNTDANRLIEGTGLGLNIIKKLVEMMEGNITVESEYGRGSTFTVTVKQQSVNSPPIGEELAQRLINFNFTSKNQNRRIITRELMPYGSVLVVDDVDTNLYVARGLLLPYKLEIELAASGFEAIEKIESGKKYDVIFMDHMMPQMDGIETTKKLRESGYTGNIVALTANALVGNDEMFAQNGFNGFIPKPIDIRQLNAILKKFIRDMHPEEAEKYKTEEVIQEESKDAFSADPLVLKVFCADAKKAIVTLKETVSSGDLKLFSITAHAMKSASANVGEHEASKSAAELENAGLKGDKDFISANIESFIQTLEDLTEKLSKAFAAKLPASDETVNEHASNDVSGQNVTEDASFLKEQLQIIKAACENYDDDTAYAALDKLKEKTWRSETSEKLTQIRDMLFIYSDFDGAAEQIVKELEL